VISNLGCCRVNRSCTCDTHKHRFGAWDRIENLGKQASEEVGKHGVNENDKDFFGAADFSASALFRCGTHALTAADGRHHKRPRDQKEMAGKIPAISIKALVARQA
jgi:hypothetical protein